MSGIPPTQLPARILRKVYREADRVVACLPSRYRKLEQGLLQYLTRTGIPRALKFDFVALRARSLGFVESLSDPTGVLYRYAASVQVPTLYGSVYALLLHSLFKNMDALSSDRKHRWLEYLNQAQSPEDGLFYDPALNIPGFRNGDWWGDRHLTGHVIMAYAALGSKPPHPFYFLEAYKSPAQIFNWLDGLKRRLPFVDASNEIMNIGLLLQYQRDQWGDGEAGSAVAALIAYMSEHIDAENGLWWRGPFNTLKSLSHAVQGAYHIQPLYLYDGITLPYADKMLDQVLRTQGILGGYGIAINSTGCEDIDSIFPLCKYGAAGSARDEVNASLARALPWVLSHQNPDGGFSWVRYRRFIYGHEAMTAKENESELFGTWFRVLSLAYLCEALDLPHSFHLNHCPGYEIS